MFNRMHCACVALVLIVASSCSDDSARSALKFSWEGPTSAQQNAPFEAKIKVTENRTPVDYFKIASGALPKGLHIDYTRKGGGETDTAKISGTPEETGTFKFVVRVGCMGTNTSGQTGEQEFAITVAK